MVLVGRYSRASDELCLLPGHDRKGELDPVEHPHRIRVFGIGAHLMSFAKVLQDSNSFC
jgi:hypothetical protein